MYTYLAEVVRVIDGDTIDVKVELGFYISQTMRLRLKGIDAPEKRGREKVKGLKSKQFVVDELAKAKVVGIRTYKMGKYGRFIAEVYFSKRVIKPENIFKAKYSLNSLLVRKKLAKRAYENM